MFQQQIEQSIISIVSYDITLRATTDIKLNVMLRIIGKMATKFIKLESRKVETI